MKKRFDQVCLGVRSKNSKETMTRLLQRSCLIAFLLVILCVEGRSTQFFISTSGNDLNPGTIGLPFLTLAKAMSLTSTVFKPGDTVYVRGGTYSMSVTLTISRIGTVTSKFCLFAYPGERALVDFSSMPVASGNRGVGLTGNYWHIRGLDIKGAGDNGMNVSGSNNVIEFCTFFENRDTGLQLGGGASNNQVINCDSYFNVDPGQGNADGFAPKLDVGSGNSFFGCRSWQNSDDGWDGYMRGANDVTTTLENCWVFKNGYLKDGSASVGNGNGFKMGGSDTKDLMHNFILKRCLAFDNRVKGFDQNNNRGSMTLYNCTGYRNGSNYAIAETLAYSHGKMLTVKNCVALGSYGTLRNDAVQQTNSWLGFNVTNADFLSVDTTGMRGPRKTDGSLPDLPFLHLAPVSPLIDAGTDVGIPFNGKAPDLGAFETGGGVNAIEEAGLRFSGFQLLPCYPNPFNPSTSISYLTPGNGDVVVGIYDLCGRVVRRFEQRQKNPGRYTVVWDGKDEHNASVTSGVYFVRADFDKVTVTRRLLLVR